MTVKRIFTSVILIAIFGFSSLLASELEIPHKFENGQSTSADDMNANFDAIEAAVKDNNTKIQELYNSTSNAKAFVGFTPTSTNGGVGIYVMQQMCDDFVSGSTICALEEIAASPYSSSAAATLEETLPAWVTQTPVFQREFSSNYSNCGNWGNANWEGTVVTASLHLSEESCAINRPVSCCK